MARLGELLVAAGLLTIDQVRRGLRAQVMWGGRLGTNLVELSFLDLDALSKALGRQHALPAALGWHFDKADRELQARLPTELAERFACVPLHRVAPDKVVIASIAQLDDRALEQIAASLGVEVWQLIPSIAGELRVRYHLDQVYRIARGARFLRARTTSSMPFAAPPVAEDTEPTDEADDLAISVEPARSASPTPVSTSRDARLPAEEPTPAPQDPPHGRDRRTYVRTLGDQHTRVKTPAAFARVSLKRLAMGSDGLPARLGIGTDASPPLTVGAAAIERGFAIRLGANVTTAARAIRLGADREELARLVLESLARFIPQGRAGAILVVRGDVALAWTGFSRTGAPLPDIAVPLDTPGLVPVAVQRNTALRAPAANLGAIDALLAGALGGESCDLLVEPIPVGGRVLGVIALTVEPGATITGLDTIGQATGAAFARLMRDAGR